MTKNTKKTNTPRSAKAGGTFISFPELCARAYPVLLQVLEHWYPDGYLDGNEFKIGDAEGNAGKNGRGSLGFNLLKGVGQEFGDGPEYKGDIIALNQARLMVALGHEVEMKDAAADLEKLLDKWRTKLPDLNARAEVVTYHPVVPVEKEQELDWDWFLNQKWVKAIIPVPRERIRKWDYRDAAGMLMQCVIRWDDNGRKQIRPLTLDGETWSWKFRHIPDGRPLYGLDRLAARPDAPVLVTEGEKAADAGAALFNDHVVISWCGGANSVDKADWKSLAGRDVVLWPDNDEAGLNAMEGAATHLREVGAKSIRLVQVPDGLAEGWDLADVVPESVELAALLAGAYELPLAESESTNVIQFPGSQPAGKDEDSDSASAKKNKKERNKEQAAKLSTRLKEFNEKYFVSREGGKTAVFSIEPDVIFKQDRTRLVVSGFTDIRQLYSNERYMVGKGERARLHGIGDIWLNTWAKRRTHLGGIIFDPSQKPGALPSEHYNLWQGLCIEAKSTGSWQLFQDHILENICRGDKTNFEYLMNWQARMYQFPGEPGQVAVVLGGKQGVGKSFYAANIGYPFHQHFLHISNQAHLAGKFNAHQRDIIVLFADESFWAGDKQGLGVLNRLITEHTLLIEAKGKDAVSYPNLVHLIMASNADWIVPAAWDARRFFVLDVGAEHRSDRAYFEAIKKELNAGGYSRMVYDLMARDIKNFDVTAFPQTEALRRQKTQSMKTKDAWWLDKLEQGWLIAPSENRTAETGDWVQKQVEVETQTLYEDYHKMTVQARDYPMDQSRFGEFLKDVLEEPNGDRIHPHKKRDRAARKVLYRFPVLGTCRETFDRYTGTPWAWPKPEDDVKEAM